MSFYRGRYPKRSKTTAKRSQSSNPVTELLEFQLYGYGITTQATVAPAMPYKKYQHNGTWPQHQYHQDRRSNQCPSHGGIHTRRAAREIQSDGANGTSRTNRRPLNLLGPRRLQGQDTDRDLITHQAR